MIGFGYDIHRLASGKPLMIGGVEVPSNRGPVAHSDGDVLLHAVCDAVLGAAALGDIGKHFPDSAAEFKNISSLELLRRVMQMTANLGYGVVNLDITVVLEEPKVGAFTDLMRERMAPILGVRIERISIKATTNEGIGAIGSGEAIAAFAVAQVETVRR